MYPTGQINPNQSVPQPGTPLPAPHPHRTNDVKITEYLKNCILGNSSYLHPIPSPSVQSVLQTPDTLSSATTVNSLPTLLPFANGNFLFPVADNDSNEGKDPETKSIMDDIIAECMKETQKYNDTRYNHFQIKEIVADSRRPDLLDLFPNRTNEKELNL
jgi:hypothetical protein